MPVQAGLQTIVYTPLAALVMVIVFAPLLLPLLDRLKLGQTVREDGPDRHRAKAGTPTMGGLLFIPAAIVATMLFNHASLEIVAIIIVTAGFSLTGFVDDYIKVARRQSLGLRARWKLAWQIFFGLLLAFAAMVELGLPPAVHVPFTSTHFYLGWFFPVFVVLVLIATSNAVNLADGLDGLAAGLCMASFAVFALIAFGQQQQSVGIFCLALIGALAGFLRFNHHPARLFMGDTGSLGLGAALGSVAVVTGHPLLLLIAGGVFVLVTLSVIIQVASFQLLGKRVFRMAPLQHHFELLGWPETIIVRRFWIAGLICAALAWLAFSYGGM